jgi:hypothetical protein
MNALGIGSVEVQKNGDEVTEIVVAAVRLKAPALCRRGRARARLLEQATWRSPRRRKAGAFYVVAFVNNLILITKPLFV